MRNKFLWEAVTKLIKQLENETYEEKIKKSIYII